MNQPDKNSLLIQRMQYQLEEIASSIDQKLNQLLSEQRIQGIQFEAMMDELDGIEKRVSSLELSQHQLQQDVETLKNDSNN